MRTNTCWAFTGNAVYAACQWMVFVMLVKKLRAADAGLFAFAVAVTGPLFVLANVRLRNLLATGFATPDGFADYFAARLLTTALAVFAALFVGAMVTSDLHALAVIVIVACAKAFDAISDICHGLFQRELNMRRAAIGLMVNGLVSAGLVAGILSVSSSLVAATAAYAVGSLIALLAWDLRRVRSTVDVRNLWAKPAARLIALQHLIWRAAPLGLSSAIGSVQMNLPRYAIAAYLGPAALAVFTALSYLPLPGHIAVNAMSQTALPLFAGDLRVSSARYRTRLLALVAGGVGFGIVWMAAIALVGKPLLAYIYSPQYAKHLDVLLWLMIATTVTFASVFFGTATTARHRFGAQLSITMTTVIVVACALGPLVSRYGLRGAAWALLLGALVELTAYIVLTAHDLRSSQTVSCAVPRAVAGGLQP